MSCCLPRTRRQRPVAALTGRLPVFLATERRRQCLANPLHEVLASQARRHPAAHRFRCPDARTDSPFVYLHSIQRQLPGGASSGAPNEQGRQIAKSVVMPRGFIRWRLRGSVISGATSHRNDENLLELPILRGWRGGIWQSFCVCMSPFGTERLY